MTTKPRSIRRALLTRLLGPLLVVTLLAAAAAYGVARHFSDAVLDQWLYDSAISLANRVRWDEGRATVDLPEGVREILEWDVLDHVFYEVVSMEGQHLGGNMVLPSPPSRLLATRASHYYEGTVSGDAVRMLAVAVPGENGNGVIVKVAETQRKRTQLARQVLGISLVFSLVLAALSVALIWHGIGRGIAAMEKAIRNARNPHSGTPSASLPFAPDMPVEMFHLVEQINKLLDDLSLAHSMNRRFIVNAAHQMRTPVASLRVHLELADREHDPHRRSEATRAAVEIVAYMSRMLHQLLTLAKADENSTTSFGECVCDLDLVAREEVERRVDDALALGVDLGYDGPGMPVPVRGNDDLVREALGNLLDNALRYGSSGRRITVGVVAAAAPELYVEDHGPGIPPAERARVVDRFYRLPGMTAEGCGLGLSIVDEIARLFDASLVLQTGADGTGLRARLIFSPRIAPLSQPPAAISRA